MDTSTIAGTASTANLSQKHFLTHLSVPQKAPTSTLRNASFATYIRPDDDDHVNQVDDSELSIFDAKKYFNDCTNEANTTNKQVDHHRRHHDVINLQHPPRLSASSLGGYGRNYRGRSFSATPTASSEASWNSKTGLLSNPPGAIAVSMRNPDDHHEKKKSGFASKYWLFGRKCPCAGKKSVQVEENLSEPRTPPHLSNKNQTQNSLQEKPNWIPTSHRISTTTRSENGFSSLVGQRVCTDGTTTTAFTFPVIKLSAPPPEVDPPRESLEIFQPSDSSRKSLGHRMLLARQSLAFPTSPKSRMTMTDDDVASDASSDLFEIESFSTQTTTYPTYHRPDSLDEASSFSARRLNGGGLYCGRSMEEEAMTPSIAGTECCYEPSEVSIDWSVTTAEGFDRGSVTNFSSVTAQEIDEMVMRSHDETYSQKKNKASGVGGGCSSSRKGNGSSSLLLSCRCQKAVSVGPSPVKCVLPAESATKHVNCQSSKPPLARSHSSR